MRQTKTARRSLAVAFGVMSAASMTVIVQAQSSKPVQGKAIQLVGSLMGVPARHAGPPDTGTTYQLGGNGDVQPLGHVTVTGDLYTPGNVVRGHVVGNVTVTGPQGSIALALRGPDHSAFDVASSALTFTVTGGTGRYAGTHGSGGASLTMTPQQRPPVIPGRPTPMYIRAAAFTLFLRGAPVR